MPQCQPCPSACSCLQCVYIPRISTGRGCGQCRLPYGWVMYRVGYWNNYFSQCGNWNDMILVPPHLQSGEGILLVCSGFLLSSLTDLWSLHSLSKALRPCLRAPASLPNSLPKVPPQHAITLQIEALACEFGGGHRPSVHGRQCVWMLWARRWVYDCVPDMEQVITLLGYNLPYAVPVDTGNFQDQMGECLKVHWKRKLAKLQSSGSPRMMCCR